MDAALTGHEYAKSAIDVACWDAAAHAQGVSVTTLLGGVRNESFPLYVAIPLGEPGGDGRPRGGAAGRGHHPVPAQGRDSPRVDAERVGRCSPLRAGRRRDRRCERRVTRRRRASPPPGLLAGLDRSLRRAALPDARGLPVRARALRAPVRPRRVHLRRPVAPARARGAGDGGVQPQDLEGGRPQKARQMRDLAERSASRSRSRTRGAAIWSRRPSRTLRPHEGPYLFTVSFMNDWTNEHVAGYEPRSSGGRGSAPAGPGLGVDVDLGRLGAPLWSTAE